MTKKMSRCLLSLFLSLAMVFTLTATPVFAASGSSVEDLVSGSIEEDDAEQSSETLEEAIETLDTTDSAEEADETETVVAKIGTTGYTTLTSAFSAASSDDTITLTSDVTVTDAEYNGDGYYLVSGKTVTLNLNKNTLSVDTTRILGVKNGGTLNVENGTIEIAEDTYSTYKQFNMVRGNSTFTATDVTFNANGIRSYAVYIASGAVATVEMTNCTFTDLTSAVVFDADNASTVTLTGCTYEKQPFSTSTYSTIENYTVVIDENSPSDSGYECNNDYTLFFNYVVADGGSISTDSTIVVNSYFGAASLTVKDGGTVSADVKVNDDTSMTVEDGTVTGTITVVKEGSEATAVSEEDSDYTVTGGLLTISGGTVTGQIKSSGTFIMTDGTVEDDSTGYSDGVVYILNGNVYVSGGTVTGTKRGFGFASSGTIGGTITGGSITGSDIALMVRANESNTVKVSGGSYTATNALYLANESDESTIFADGYSAYNTEGTALSSTLSGTVTLYKSSLDDKTVIVDVAGAVCKNSTTGTLYASLAEAIAATESGDTITLLTNAEVSDLITVSTTVTLDLNGCSVTPNTNYNGTNMFAVASGGSLTINDSGEDGNITAANRAILVYSGGTLAVTGGTVHGDSIGIFSNGGTVNVFDGTVSCYETSSNGTYTSYSAIYCDTTSCGSLNISGGEVTGYRGIINWGSDVTISGGTVSAASAAVAIQQTGGSLTISGGTVTNTGTGQAILISQGASAMITGGTITAPYEGYGVGVLIQKGSLTMTGGSVYGHNFGIGTNGTNSDSYYPNTIKISGGTVSGTYGMYLPAVSSTTTISGTAEITGTSTGIEIRAGELTVNSSAVIKSTSETFSLKTNGNGATVVGAGIAISQHSTDQTVTVTINGGTISGYYGVYEWNTYENNTSAVNLTISGDTTVTATGSDGEAVYSKSVSESANDYTTVTISGGTYSTEVAAEYCADGYAPTSTTSDGVTTYGVTEFKLGVSGGSSETVSASIASGYGTNTLYVGVSASNINSKYSTSAYPTTDLTYTSDGSVDSGSYIFAGWYTLDEDGSYIACTSDMWSSTSEDAYYAKFVDANVLSVQCAFTYNVSGYGNIWRFFTSTDSKYFQKIIFTVTDGDGNAVTSLTTSYDYPSYEVTRVSHTFYPTDFSSASNYVLTAYYIDSDKNLNSCTVTASWVTKDGTTVSGSSFMFTQENSTAVLTGNN